MSSTTNEHDDAGWAGQTGRRWAEAQQRMDALLRPFGEAVIDAAQIDGPLRVLDVGCGCGATTRMAARRDAGVRAIGVDLSPDMLAVARNLAAAEGLSIDFRQADAAAATFDAPVDRIISRFGVMFFDDPPAAFANLRRALAPGGRLALLVWNPLPENPWITDPLRVAGRHVEADLPQPQGPGPFGLADREATAALLREAGFGEVEHRDLDIPMRIERPPEDVLTFHLERLFLREILDAASAEQREAIVDDLRVDLIDRHDGVGVTHGASARLLLAAAS